MIQNPFRIGGHVAGSYFTDRADEIRRIRQAIKEPSRLLVYGPRRMGKSSTIAKAVEQVKREGAVVAWADFSTATTLADISNRLLMSLSGELNNVEQRLLNFARNLRPNLTLRFDELSGSPSLTLGAEARRKPIEDQRAAFEAILDQIEAFATSHDRPVALVFDEFQEIIAVGGERADWFLRGIMQRHQHVSYICAGSKESLIHELLGQKRAFYKHFELLHLGPIEADHLALWIEDRMRSKGVDAKGLGKAIIERAGPRTQDRLQLAREIFSNALPKGYVEATDIDHAMSSLAHSEASIYLAIWSELSPTQQNSLRAVAAAPDQLFASSTLQRFGLASSSTMARALEVLQNRGLVVQEEGRPEIDNPFFCEWIKQELLPDTP